nr:hypothetical protein CFP56_57321 [Quercus suber]
MNSSVPSTTVLTTLGPGNMLDEEEIELEEVDITSLGDKEADRPNEKEADKPKEKETDEQLVMATKQIDKPQS